MDYIKYLKEGSFNSLVYRYYEPDTNAKRPLLVLLHGHGERGNDNIANLNNFDISSRMKTKWGSYNLWVPFCFNKY